VLVTTLSSREVSRNPGRAKRASRRGPVIITDRGKPAHVLLSYEEYQRLTARHRQTNIIDELGLPPGVADLPVEFPSSRELAPRTDFT